MNNQQLWNAISGSLEVAIKKSHFFIWHKNTWIIERTPEAITIGVPNAFIQKLVEKIHKDIQTVVKSIDPEIKYIKYAVGKRGNNTTEEPSPQTQQSNQAAVKPTATVVPSGNHNLNPRYVFDSFIIGKHNQLAHAASIGVANNPGSHLNPLFIYGGVGLGKTHLMHAVGNHILKDNPSARVLYVSSEKFTNDYVQALQQKRMDEFKRIYRSVDILLVDDIQFIAGKEGTQEEFFHTFNELYNSAKQVILTADRLPKDIPSIEQRLISRFQQGMVADIQSPDYETRLAILQTKAQRKGAKIDLEVLQYIAENIVNNIRELEGALNRLIVAEQIEKQTVTTDHAKAILATIINNKKKQVSMDTIAHLVAEFYNVTIDDLIKQSRRKEYVKPRQIAMFIIRTELDNSYPVIGEFFGGRDHTTVMHGVEKITNETAQNPTIKQEVELLKEKLYNT